MTIRKRITLICAVLLLTAVVVNNAESKSKLPVLKATPKIKVKHSRIKDQSTPGLQMNLSKVLTTAVKQRVIKVEASAYTLSKGETDATPFITSTGKLPIAGKTCAVSRDQRHRLMHKMILIPGLGFRIVNDTMHHRYKNSIDVVFHSRKAAKDFGRKDVQIVVLN